MLTRLIQIQEATHERVASIISAHENWPCHEGCDDCCRNLVAEPRVSQTEWERISAAMEALPDAEATRNRVRANAGRSRRVVCALLDTASGRCRIYEARPIACRTYGFYAERDKVLGCHRIETLAHESPEILWGNHASVERDLKELGVARELSSWLDTTTGSEPRADTCCGS